MALRDTGLIYGTRLFVLGIGFLWAGFLVYAWRSDIPYSFRKVYLPYSQAILGSIFFGLGAFVYVNLFSILAFTFYLSSIAINAVDVYWLIRDDPAAVYIDGGDDDDNC